LQGGPHATTADGFSAFGRELKKMLSAAPGESQPNACDKMNFAAIQ